MNKVRILVVEDEKVIALDMSRRLERFGYQVVGMASNGLEAITMALNETPDIILMDIMLSGDMDGIESAKQIKTKKDIPVIFLTAFTDENTLERAKEVAPYGYIIKPFKERELFTTIDVALYKRGIETKLHHQERLFSAILHTISDGIIASDMDFNVQFMNPVAEEICGIHEEEARGMHISELLRFSDPKSREELDSLKSLGEGRAIVFADAVLDNSRGLSYIIDGNVKRIHEEDNATDGYLFALRDVTQLKNLSDTLNYQSSHDNLTGLTNREEFSYKLGEIIKNVRLTGGTHALIIIDVDRFKAVNDTCGSAAGDELLRQIASHIQINIQRNDIPARIGGDEFAIILMNCNSSDSINVAARLQSAVQRQRFIWQNINFPVSLSIGVVAIDREAGDIHSVLAAGDHACHVSKEEGGAKTTVFHAHDSKFRKRRGDMEWIGKINHAIEENRFVLFQQPIIPLLENSPMRSKLEVLLRLVNEDGSISRPNDFIPAAERYNLMPQIDRWVIENSMRAYRILSDQGNEAANSVFSINLSGPSLLDDKLVDVIMFYLRKYSLNANDFCFEITETAAIQNLSYATRFINRLRVEGFTFALDDFGAGFSSFGYLRSLPVDYVKIDGSFVQNLDESLISFTMVDSINSIGHVMGLGTIAEFVKNEKIVSRLAELGVDYGQGYFFSEPLPLFPKGS